MSRRVATLASLALLFHTLRPALAEEWGPDPAPCPPDVTGCHGELASWSYRDALFDDVYLDTGWVPSGSDVQLRFGLAIGGSTRVDMAGTVLAVWPPALGVSAVGAAGTGRLAINYGIELVARLRFDVEVAGIRYDWEGDIPVPGIPEDLRMAGETVFDPFLLPGALDRPATVHDLTDPVRVLRYDALGSIIPIPGVGGGLVLALQGELQAGYLTDRIGVAGAESIEEELGWTTLLPEPGGYGPSALVEVHPEGTLSYDGRVLLLPSLYIEVLGVRFDYPIAEIPVRLVDSAAGIVFDPALVEVPLPDVDVQPRQLDLGAAAVGRSAEGSFAVLNLGLAELDVRARVPDGPFSLPAGALTVGPGEAGRLGIVFEPTAPGEVAAMVRLQTNDPDEPEVVVMVLAEGLAAPEPDAGPELDADLGDDEAGELPSRSGGCACGAATGQAPGGWSAALALLLGLSRSAARSGLSALRRRAPRARPRG